MKLLFCPLCFDVKGLVMAEWRECLCGESGGQYNKDGMTATLGGVARVFGVGNPFFNELYPFLNEEGIAKVRQKFYGHQHEAWWGEYPGDTQIFRIRNADGPRLKVRISDSDRPLECVVAITDKREYWIDGKFRLSHVLVPKNVKVKTRWNTNEKKKLGSTDMRRQKRRQHQKNRKAVNEVPEKNLSSS